MRPKSDILFSIVIPAYNVAEFIGTTLESCLSQIDFPKEKFEIIVIDDGSPDKSGEIAKSILCQESNSRVIRQENRGLGGARNTGIEHARGKYIWFVDSDDWINNKSLKILESKAAASPDIIMINAANIKGNKIESICSYTGTASRSSQEIFLSNEWTTCVPFLIIRRELLMEKNLRFKEHLFHEDNEFTPRLLLSADSICQTNEILYYVRQNPASITRTPNPKKSFDLLVVAESLTNFLNGKNYSGAIRRRMHSFIALSLNVAFLNMISQPKHIQKQFNNEFKKSGCLNSYFKSCDPRYIARYCILLISPNKCTGYKVLNTLREIL